MPTTLVASTTLASVTYDAPSQLLTVEFRDRSVYQYLRVPAAVYERLLAASSKGKHFNQAIRGRFAYARLPAADPA